MPDPAQRCFALVPCAGVGRRAGAEGPKQYASVAGRSVVAHTLAALVAVREIEATLVVLAPEDRVFESHAPRFEGPRAWVARCGGATRAASVANGLARTSDLRFESNDLLLTAAGTVTLDGSAVNLVGQLQLSDKLSQQAGRDLVRYTQEQGRVTLPAMVTGSAASPQVRIDMAAVGRHAVTNRAKEEVQGAVKKGLGRLFGK